jgi:predicted  nucleic acid-binding Zn-ribbon protein
MKQVSDPEWRALEVKILAWDERIRTREREIHQLDERLRELEQRMGQLKRRLAVGTGVMAAVPEPTDD